MLKYVAGAKPGKKLPTTDQQQLKHFQDMATDGWKDGQTEGWKDGQTTPKQYPSAYG
ncbi:hypothetical protein DPMN_028859 [Dreissena polymorpha]|uniref:Uncharacterized protein n=1 Tax=Dreissena polymorpha TaxID=45954 RepID=A0A9D4RGV1_DREPO|nr:hypothetical protein DPMN_028859 [Dreissena polymorpha]